MIDWSNLPFGYMPTHANIRCVYTNGTWGDVTVHTEETITLHMAATCLHYGQECFEGLKAYRGNDNTIRLFRWQENAKRMSKSAQRIGMPEIPEELFKDMLFTLLKHNTDFIPPYGTGASLYIRPLMIGIEGKLGLSASTEYLFVMFCSPVGPYYKDGCKPVKVIIERDSDRAAPLGTGNVKVGGNYAAAVNATLRAHQQGYSSALYLDPKEKKYIDECGPANFFAIKNNSYITPQSSSILESITNLSLMKLAANMGMKVEQRNISLDELPTFEEAGQCGTAAVVTPICEIYDPVVNVSYTYGSPESLGAQSMKLYNTLVGIQYGDVEDTEGWVTVFK